MDPKTLSQISKAILSEGGKPAMFVCEVCDGEFVVDNYKNSKYKLHECEYCDYIICEKCYCEHVCQ